LKQKTSDFYQLPKVQSRFPSVNDFAYTDLEISKNFAALFNDYLTKRQEFVFQK